MEFLSELLKVSEKAANIARVIRKNDHLFNLLVQQKKADEANPRFLIDFKTLADVLIQEMVKHDLGLKFPELKDKIRGEENNIFCNKLGEEIIVEVQETQDETAEILEKVLNHDPISAQVLSEEVHRIVDLGDIKSDKLPQEDFELNFEELGVWIDPIDSTTEYINALDEKKYDLSTSGLNCVTILIGVYNINTGCPVIGIVNQPFSKNIEDCWIGECFWGVSLPNYQDSSLNPLQSSERRFLACLSSLEDAEVKLNLKDKSFGLIESAGAGYKILLVITGRADCYVLSKSSTFKWDTCGPHAILRSLGGDIVEYHRARNGQVESLRYNFENNSNENGLIAFRNVDILHEIMK